MPAWCELSSYSIVIFGSRSAGLQPICPPAVVHCLANCAEPYMLEASNDAAATDKIQDGHAGCLCTAQCLPRDKHDPQLRPCCCGRGPCWVCCLVVSASRRCPWPFQRRSWRHHPRQIPAEPCCFENDAKLYALAHAFRPTKNLSKRAFPSIEQFADFAKLK